MADHLNVVPDEYRRAALEHRETAAHLSALPGSHDDLLASLESLGPIFGEFKEAGRELLEQRRICYQQQADAHASMADKLEHAATLWESQDADAAQQFQRVHTDNLGTA